MFSGPLGYLFSILTNVVFTSSFVYLCYSMCIFSHCVYKKSAKIINFFKTQKTPKKPNKTQKKPNPYPRKGQTGIGFFWVTPPPQVTVTVKSLVTGGLADQVNVLSKSCKTSIAKTSIKIRDKNR